MALARTFLVSLCVAFVLSDSSPGGSEDSAGISVGAQRGTYVDTQAVLPSCRSGTVVVKARASNDIHVGFAAGVGQPVSIEVVIGGWRNGMSAIRPCSQCEPLVTNTNLRITSLPMEFDYFWIALHDGTVTVGPGQVPAVAVDLPADPRIMRTAIPAAVLALGGLCVDHVRVSSWDQPILYQSIHTAAAPVPALSSAELALWSRFVAEYGFVWEDVDQQGSLSAQYMAVTGGVPPCQFSFQGQYYDLTPLNRGIGPYFTGLEMDREYPYQMNLCANVGSSIPLCAQYQGAICQFKNDGTGAFNSVVGRWSAFENNPPVISLSNPSNPSGGIVIKFTNGDNCVQNGAQVPRTAVVTLTCQKNGQQVMNFQIVFDPSNCLFQIAMPSPSACPNSAPPTPPAACPFILSQPCVVDTYNVYVWSGGMSLRINQATDNCANVLFSDFPSPPPADACVVNGTAHMVAHINANYYTVVMQMLQAATASDPVILFWDADTQGVVIGRAYPSGSNNDVNSNSVAAQVL